MNSSLLSGQRVNINDWYTNYNEASTYKTLLANH